MWKRLSSSIGFVYEFLRFFLIFLFWLMSFLIWGIIRYLREDDGGSGIVLECCEPAESCS